MQILKCFALILLSFILFTSCARNSSETISSTVSAPVKSSAPAQTIGNSGSAQNEKYAQSRSYVNSDLCGNVISHLSKQYYGGIYLDDNGNLVILVTNYQQAAKIVNEYKQGNQSVIYKNAKYSKQEIESVYNLLIPRMRTLGITDMSIDDINDCVTVGIYHLNSMDKKARDKLEQSIRNYAKSGCVKIVNDATKSHEQ